jgi:hypothetical protein
MKIRFYLSTGLRRVHPGRERKVRIREKIMGIAELAGESACPTLALKNLRSSGVGAFACQPIFYGFLSDRVVDIF